MIKKTIKAWASTKKPYAAPQVEAYNVKPSTIMCTSPGNGSTEEYNTGDTSTWFNGF